MKIGIIGSGNVGGTLGTRWARLGHTVIFGSREPDSPKMAELVARAGETAKAATIEDAAQACDILLLATPWEATRKVVETIVDFGGKVLIDAVNPLLPNLAGLAVGTTTSGAEQIAQWALRARVVKAFNTVGANVMANPVFAGDRPVMFFCGDDADAKAVVKDLADELGFDGRDAGPLTQARVLEPFALFWISLAYVAGYGRDIAFKFLWR